VSTGTQEIVGAFEHGVWRDHVLEDVIHGDDVVSSDVTGKVCALERPLKDVVSSCPTLGRDVRLDLNARTFQVEEATEFVEVPAVAGADVEDTARAAPDQSAIETGPGPGPELDQEPGDAAMVLVVGVVVARIEGRELRFQGAGVQELGSAVPALLHIEIAGWNHKVFEINDVAPVEPGVVRAADRAADQATLELVRCFLDTADR
jgi:hypothetical protein